MSHHFWINCPKCQEVSPDFNRRQTELVELVKDLPELIALNALSKSQGWKFDLNDLEHNGQTYPGVAEFLIEHSGCPSFQVEGEYTTDVPIVIKNKLCEK